MSNDKGLFLDKREWFVETSFPGVRRCKTDAFRVTERIFSGRSQYQNIEVFKSPGFGRMLALDGIIQLSEKDEFIYHEMITHPPLLSHPNPQRMLVIGGGDGGVLREALKHPLKEIYFVDIDKEVVGIAKRHLNFIAQNSFSNKRVKVFIEDGRKFIKEYKNFFDIIVVDSTDPVGPGKVLFEAPFYKLVYEALTENGIAMFQLGPFLDFDLIIKPTAKKLQKLFKYVKPVRLAMPSYSCGCEYCFMMASKKINPTSLKELVIKQRLCQRLGKKAKGLKYYTPAIHLASMVMPKLWQI
ncbi:MAG: polyamine aminopropyltransferase [Candidatus Omnitrophica bacterium]|nr:polyamine aminopropyltransferase [Candidatus Omnitrophota bacterium]